MGLGASAGLETDRLIWREEGPALAPVLLCWKVMGWVPFFFKPWHVEASDGRHPSSLPTSDSWAPGTLPLLPRPSPGYMVTAVVREWTPAVLTSSSACIPTSCLPANSTQQMWTHLKTLDISEESLPIPSHQPLKMLILFEGAFWVKEWTVLFKVFSEVKKPWWIWFGQSKCSHI